MKNRKGYKSRESCVTSDPHPEEGAEEHAWPVFGGFLGKFWN
jgi:hypothetical protein